MAQPVTPLDSRQKRLAARSKAHRDHHDLIIDKGLGITGIIYHLGPGIVFHENGKGLPRSELDAGVDHN